MDQDASFNGRNGPEAWIEAAYDLLIARGVGAVKVQPLAESLGLTRTSFYWHFKDRDALLDALVGKWQAKNTGNLVARCEAYAATINEAVFNLFDCWLEPGLFDSRLDLAIRNWSLGDPLLKARVQANDHERIAAIRAMFLRFGYTADQAETRAFSIYYTQIGYISMMVIEPVSLRLSRMPAYAETFTGFTPGLEETERFLSRHPT